ncbi:GSCFA domain-containing protein [Maribacter polysiphoniae]|uniref:GSCFA domain-containing protein n=1 Tax=Maribacter polysiphoniae TaxID=429344 RepID=A0A316DL78_9FLAO|nr:GSCFA domain-containing protein [Maribacter polysiphoniae]MBD1263077.1 GSCFA domain-containing protein [Maribacter polysiphoniae]PWK18831.1 GSCFA family protein [Maribacter polysiphoniae]
MKLQTQVPLQQVSDQIDYHSRLLLMGSCFVENMGAKLDYFKFRVLQNPFGILFHPKAIGKLILKSIQEEEYKESDIFYHNEQWHCFDAHSDLSDASKENLLLGLNKGLSQTRKELSVASHVLITLGTAWVYRHIETNSVVANCHKVPQKAFSKELLSIEDISESLEHTIDALLAVNPKVKIVITISPVRHLKDGFVENQRSKAHLLSALHQVLQSRKYTEALSYFASYEIMMDELRDYRFYKSDMVHPNELAVDYIWEKFNYVWISGNARQTMAAVDDIQKGLKHRAFYPESEQHRKFLEKLHEKITRLQKLHPFMTFNN